MREREGDEGEREEEEGRGERTGDVSERAECWLREASKGAKRGGEIAQKL